MKPGDPDFLLSKARHEVDGKPGRLIAARSMSEPAQKLWREDTMRKAAQFEASQRIVSSATSAQISLLPQTEIDNKIAALNVSRSARDLILRRYRIVAPCMNHNWKAEGYATKGAFLTILAECNQTSSALNSALGTRLQKDRKPAGFNQGTDRSFAWHGYSS